jgi:biopolymer transport protein ExbD
MRTVHKQVPNKAVINNDKSLQQKRVDEILDKISKSGYDSLSAEEKEFLFRVGQNQ